MISSWSVLIQDTMINGSWDPRHRRRGLKFYGCRSDAIDFFSLPPSWNANEARRVNHNLSQNFQTFFRLSFFSTIQTNFLVDISTNSIEKTRRAHVTSSFVCYVCPASFSIQDGGRVTKVYRATNLHIFFVKLCEGEVDISYCYMRQWLATFNATPLQEELQRKIRVRAINKRVMNIKGIW